ncbi:sn-glycerol-3-phosphate ABC transporter ATP-binding protein UgpC [Euhalothece natronophila Z-M001]|uniref:sn-glycerol-3-phosphate ABC transporter ATP-binding protein UgpC n=1 Tax=Euhalothece natronophila Z-M001 TaxID=522448 RepID=A0A5B8NPD3_9CHRO|nr:sn-glycerol-3-phosphate ABC transporter ATP-binding protein UgpC [Euhalothece natronophila]QDZ40059.1 sn-glycerol-3-phosphate ABC transporter ATP-binding protein UgpC [Euhalothece natronophila Z-M001]
MAKVALKDVSRYYGNTSAIADISLTIEDGQFCVLVGRSGCGKSTLLRTIAGLEAVSQGSIYINDRRVNDLPARNRDVAMVFQNYALYPHFTVAENLGFGLKMRKTDKKTINQQVKTIAQSLGIAHLLQRKPKQLSGGQQQRVALGRAIIRQPQAFLLDEPLSNLDTQLREETRAELKRLHQELKITTIYVTHDQVEAMTLAEKLVVLDEGKIQQIGSPEEVYNNPANMMVAGFLGNPPMNLIKAQYQDGELQIGKQTVSIPENLNNHQLSHQNKVYLGIRPEAISDISSSEMPDMAKLTLQIELIEPLGRETLLRGKIPETEEVINFFVSGTWSGKPKDQLTVAVDLKQVFIFNEINGERIV